MITFTNQEVRFSLKNKSAIKKWLVSIVELEKKKAGDLAYIFCSDDFLLGLNKQYLKHDTLTDIITFDYSEDEKIAGDIFISIERVKENAGLFSKSFEQEIARVMAHGVLHLIGYKDKSAIQKTQMRAKEEEYLASCPLSV